MATQTGTPTRPKQDMTVEQKIQQLRELYADAPEMGKGAGERAPSAQVAGRRRWHRPRKALAGSAFVRARSRSSP